MCQNRTFTVILSCTEEDTKKKVIVDCITIAHATQVAYIVAGVMSGHTHTAEIFDEVGALVVDVKEGLNQN